MQTAFRWDERREEGDAGGEESGRDEVHQVVLVTPHEADPELAHRAVEERDPLTNGGFFASSAPRAAHRC